MLRENGFLRAISHQSKERCDQNSIFFSQNVVCLSRIRQSDVSDINITLDDNSIMLVS